MSSSISYRMLLMWSSICKKKKKDKLYKVMQGRN
jgi:hypothetical protein